MLLSTAIPIVIAAIVIVIMSRGIPSKPIIPKIKKAAIKFGAEKIIYASTSGIYGKREIEKAVEEDEDGNVFHHVVIPGDRRPLAMDAY